MTGARTIVVDCDPAFGVPGADVDDCLALLLALRCRNVSLKLATIVAGNVPAAVGSRCLAHLLRLAGRSDLPWAVGAERPLVEDDRPWRRELDGRGRREPAVSLWRSVPMAAETEVERQGSAADAIARAVLHASDAVTLVALGPLTNVATALRCYPDLARTLERIVVMGGAIHLPGSANELNFGYDPEAAQAVLASGAAVTVVPLDITRTTFLRAEENARLAASPDPAVRTVAEVAAPWIAWVRAQRGQAGCHLHDPLAVAIALRPDLVTTVRLNVAVELTGTHTRGRLVTWHPRSASLRPDLPIPDAQADVVQELAVEQFMDFMFDELGAAPDA